MNDIYTIGHSNTSFPEFEAKLDAHKIDILVDIRSHPGSRHVLWATKAALKDALKDRYFHLPELGGPTDGDYSDPLNFPKHRIGRVRDEFKKVDKKDRPKTWWNQGLRDYDLWMGSDPKFRLGLTALNRASMDKRVAICCSEVLWWKCHRSMVSDAIVAMGGVVKHIMSVKSVDDHPTGEALQDRLLRYDETTRKLWA
jgi:uncharacterized protein (DUF488 family)